MHLLNMAGKPLECASLFVHVDIGGESGTKRKSKVFLQTDTVLV